MATPMISAHPLPISITTPSRDSMTFTSTKGLLNGPGQNNCFLNSAVQVLWHLDIFRRSFRDLSGHACMADSCIFCALKELFSQLQFSNETALPPDALRRALAESFFDQQRFQLGFMDDAAECFENMLLRIHMHIANGEAEDMCNARHCIPHQKFAMTLVEQSVCGSCGATSEPLSYTQMVHYVSTSTLVYQVRTNANRSQMMEPFGQLLRKAGGMGDIRVCPSACGAVIQIGRTLMNRPEIVSVGLVWNSERPTLEHIMEVFSTIGTTLRLSDVFNTVVDSRWAETCVHNLVGVVTYYGKHYSTFFFHTKLRVWIYFDDATVREVGPRWEQVVEKCRKGRYQPLLLLYALPDGTPVNTENAPKQVTPFYNEKTTGKKTPNSILRRSVTPSPEKPHIGNTRRAITPNPDCASKPPLPRPYNEYQNLSVIQSNLYNNNRSVDVVDGDMPIRKEPDYVTRKSIENGNIKHIHRTLSNGSSSGTEACFRDYLNIPRTRDSGNWSSDRNSASSSSSTTMENPYLYLVGKVPHENGNIVRNESSSSNSSGVYDVGYDSYSLSSNDSSTMTTIQHLMKMGHLAKIPEDYNTAPQQISQSCDVLCDEADELLVKSRQLEDDHDLVLALALCNAAATKARAAMDAPYNNPQTLTLARMKHNTCIMRARSLHRRMTQSQSMLGKDMPPEIRHTREGSSGSGKHSRQSSRDKGQHSRQNSRELLTQLPPQEKLPVKSIPTKNIEIYATLPKKKDGLKKYINIEEDAEYVLYDKPSPGRESRSIFSRSKNKDSQKTRDKRSRSEDRNKMSHDFSIAPEIITGKDTLKKAKEEKEEKKDKEKGKKQHKIRRKLLMGGLIRRKNRSMPDLTDTNEEVKPNLTVDDSNLGLKNESAVSMCGYLSEGHLEFTGNSTNPNLERSKLMRKSFHGSAGKILTAAKVPPPPPLRTTSQLSKSKLNGGEEETSERPQYPLPNEIPNQYYQYASYPYPDDRTQPVSNTLHATSMPQPSLNMVVTRADVHQEHVAPKLEDQGVDEVDCMPMPQSLDLPPYPSPLGSAVHSRQASEEFPPPPPPLDLSALDEHLPDISPPPTPSPGSLLAQLQNKRQEILSQDSEIKHIEPAKSSGDTWLKELQAKQAALRIKKQAENINGESQKCVPAEDPKLASVKDLTSKFENIKPEVSNTVISNAAIRNVDKTNYLNNSNGHHNGVLTTRKRDEVEPPEEIDIPEEKRKLGKKKSVSFCDQVILVATAEEQEDDSYIPNPILERVLRSAMNKPETAAIRQEVQNLRQQERSVDIPPTEKHVQPFYAVRRNSMDNLLSRQNSIGSAEFDYYSSSRFPPQSNVSPNPNVPTLQNPGAIPNVSIQNSQMSSGPIQNSHVPMPNTHGPNMHSPNLQNHDAVHNSNMQNANMPNPNIYIPNMQSPNMQNPNMQNPNMQNPNMQIPNMQSPNMQSPNMHSPNVPTVHHNVPNAHVPNLPHYSHPNHPQYRSPYERIPQNSPIYATKQQMQNSPYQQVPTQQYKPQDYNAPRSAYPAQMRQSPSPAYPVYQHPPSPAPSNVSSNCTYPYQRQQSPYDNRMQYAQRIPTPEQYQKPPENYSPYQTVPHPALYRQPERNPSENYHRVPPSHMEQQEHYPSQAVYPPYQHALPPKQLLKKTVSFEPGTKGGAESPTPKAIVTPIIVNNANNSVPTGKTKCNLCRKKAVVSSNLYCTDCEFYMSRFKPKR